MPDEYLKTVRVGTASVTIINIGYFRDPNITPEEGAKNPSAGLPAQFDVIQLPDTVALVDASVYHLTPDSPFFIPGYQPPPDMFARLAELGIQPEQVAHVIITHTHFDHINGLTVERDGVYSLAFPNARYYLGQADWEDAETQTDLQDPNSLESHTLGVLHKAGLLELIASNRQLTPELQIIHAPGETPGHQIVRLSSQGQVLYLLGDLFHDSSSFANPDHMDPWAERSSMLASRAKLVDAALADNALLTAAHIGTVGRLQPTDSGVSWQSV